MAHFEEILLYLQFNTIENLTVNNKLNTTWSETNTHGRSHGLNQTHTDDHMV